MKLRILLAAACLAMASGHADAESSAALPPMNFVSSVAPEELFTALKQNPAFANLSKESVGCPIVLLVTHSLRPTAAGKATGFLSALWSGTTLGLLPVVTNNTLAVTYIISVNGKDVATFSYEHNFTRATNIWTAKNDRTHGLGREGLEWLESTAAEFAKAASQDAAIAKLRREYDFYFAAQPTK